MNNLSKSKKTILIAIIAIAVGIFGYYIYGRDTADFTTIEDEEIMVKPEKTEEEATEKIMVHITGAVKNEGVYTLNENSRVNDAVLSAGGLREDADMHKINLAYVLEDGMKLHIPSINDTDDDNLYTDSEDFVEIIPESTKKSEKSSSVVNINKASQAELETLPGIGPSIAMQIINYREENGKFTSINDLKNVSGIGDAKFEKIRELVSVK